MLVPKNLTDEQIFEYVETYVDYEQSKFDGFLWQFNYEKLTAVREYTTGPGLDNKDYYKGNWKILEQEIKYKNNTFILSIDIRRGEIRIGVLVTNFMRVGPHPVYELPLDSIKLEPNPFVEEI